MRATYYSLKYVKWLIMVNRHFAIFFCSPTLETVKYPSLLEMAEVHEDITCNGCLKEGFVGARYKCGLVICTYESFWNTMYWQMEMG